MLGSLSERERKVLALRFGLVTGEPEAYAYLNRTSSAFPCGEEFLALMDEAGGFSERRAISMTGGICWLYVGTVA